VEKQYTKERLRVAMIKE
jgi:uncharacterized protein YicC (UPF0701 family)